MKSTLLRTALGAAVAVLVFTGQARALTYEEAVPESLRTLVTQAAFDDARSSLQPLVDGGSLQNNLAAGIAGSPCAPSISRFVQAVYANEPHYQAIFDEINAGFTDPPAAYNRANPWRVDFGSSSHQHLIANLVASFVDWCVFLPQINGDQDNGLKYILDFAWFFYRNPAGQVFTQGLDPMTGAPESDVPRLSWTISPSSAARSWTRLKALPMSPSGSTTPASRFEDYQRQDRSADYESWNAFFAREITIDEAYPDHPLATRPPCPSATMS